MEADAVLSLLGQAKFQSSIVRAVMPPSEPGVKNWQRYRSRFVEPYRIRKGVEFWANHVQALEKTQEKTGVPASIVTAIIGVETIYGEHTGNYRTIDALTTLAFDYPNVPKNRSEFFKAELLAFLKLAQESGLDPLVVKGSYAGAIGLGQFMPSSWRNFAVDGSGDGRIDLFHNVDDAIASVGQFLATHGWVKDGLWFATFTGSDPEQLMKLIHNDITPRYTVADLKQLGIKPDVPVKVDEKFALIDLPNGVMGQPALQADNYEYRLGPQNFYVISRYNRSSFYALSVLELAQALEVARNQQQLRAQAGNTPVDK